LRGKDEARKYPHRALSEITLGENVMPRVAALAGLMLVLLCGLVSRPAAADDAQVRYVITNGGADVGDKGQAHFFPTGNHDSAVTWANSGTTVQLPPGNYDVQVNWSDGAAQKEIWLNNQAFSDKVDKTVEIGVRTTEVRYVITNGGTDVGDKGQVHYFPAGKHDSAVTWASSGNTVRMPEGSYDVQVTWSDGAAQKELWLTNQDFAGKIDKSVELGVRTTDVRYVITNGGADVGDKGQVHYFPAGKHNSLVTWAGSGRTVRMPEGTYDVQVTWSDGSANKEKWIENQTFAGKVERTVDIGLITTDVRYLITNGSVDVGDKGQAHYFAPGKHDGDITWAVSGGTVRLREGTYDVRVTYTNGLAHKEVWLDNQAFSGKVEKTVELGMTLAEPTISVTLDGGDVGTHANVTYLAPGGTQDFGAVSSSTPTVIEAGTYDIRARFGAGEGWLRAATVSGSPHLSIELQQPKPAPAPFVLAAPATTPERVSPDNGDFPYLAPVPGSTATGSKANTGPVYVQLPDAHQPELVANASIVKSYHAPAGMSLDALLAIYHDALLKAGWTIVSELHRPDATLVSHYGQNSRNIWAFIHIDNGGYSLTVADATVLVSKLVADLSSNCHLALTGVLFDFDKSTLNPESDPILQQVSVVMAQASTLRLEVQGHTDGVGSDAYNQRLSEARARSVVTWLTQHGVAAARLTARGYGKTRPVATNATEAGRAQNRRVEIADPACRAKG
jgi:OOP family OmpA-OmpF porin